MLLKNLFLLFIIIIIWNETFQMTPSRHFFSAFQFWMIFFIIIYCMTNKDI